MNLAVISFTRAGSRLCVNLVRGLGQKGETCRGYVLPRFLKELAGEPDEKEGKSLEDLGIYPLKEPVSVWTGRQFGQVDGLIYIGATGIGVRAIAPFLRDKMTDPAVVVVDEQGKYAISLLSGHVGGANELAKTVAGICGALPVITTATDINKKTAIDGWAARQGFRIGDRELAKQISVWILEDRPVGFFSDFSLENDRIPQGYVSGEVREKNVWVTARKAPGPGEALWQAFREGQRVLRLIPPALTVGIGCRKGVSPGRIEETVREILEREGWEEQAVARFASIDLKKEEEGICCLARKWGIPFVTFSAQELETVREPVAESAFVRQVTGTGNVCERAALLGAGEGGILAVRKQVREGVTVAVAMEGEKQ